MQGHFSNTESAINHMSFDNEQLITAQRVFRIVDLRGPVLMEDQRFAVKFVSAR